MFEQLWRRPGRTVLIVSEDPSTTACDGSFLEQPDIRLLTSYPGEALDIVRRERPCLIIEDLASADGAGMRFCLELRSDRHTRSIPLILLAASAARDRAGAAGADALLDKPLAPRELYRAVRRFLPLPRRRVERLVTNLRFTFCLDGQRFQAFSRDISERGTFLKSDCRPALGARVDLRFRLPGSGSEIRCAGLVRSTCDGDPHGRAGGLGIEFVELEQADREHLAAFIERQAHAR
jgi:CheY-like chemotaxis protein